MKKLIAGLLLCAALGGVGLLAVPGCITPPSGTMFIDTNGDGLEDALAFDLDKNRVPDTDKEGNILIVPGSEGYKTAAKVDATVPAFLQIAGAILGVPVLVGVGAVWKGAGFGKIFMNTVMSIQAARQRMKDKGMAEALALLDESLSENQLLRTVEMVKEAKEKLGIASVTGSNKPPA